MAAYAAVISLLQTIEQFQQRTPEFCQTAEALKTIHATAEYFQLVLDEVSCKSRRFGPEMIKSLEEIIRVAASDAEHVAELKIFQINRDSSFSGMINSYPIQHHFEEFSPVVKKIDSTKKEVMEIVSDFNMARSTTGASADEIEILGSGDTLIGSSSTSNIPILNLKDDIVQGLEDDLEMIVERLTGPLSDLDVVTITGMGGIGKTTLARKAYDHPTIRYRFDILVWVTISQEFRKRNVLLDALHCISNANKKDYDWKSDNTVADLVQKNLKGRRYLFVVDDIWSMDVWDSIRGIFPDYNNKSRILMTTRQTEVALYASPTSPHEMNLLNLDNSWKLLRDKVFGPKHDHPLELEEIGKQIAGKCQGLPLTILVIAGHLSKMARKLESWTDVAHTLGEIVASHQDKCLGVLGLSYHYLPNHLKPCFLLMGSFPEDFQVETWRLIQLWIAEGIIKTSESYKSLEEVAEVYLEDLISRNLILVRKRRFNGEIKACGMHDVLREFCLIEAEMTQFMHVQRTHDGVPTVPTQKHNVRRFRSQIQICSVDNYKLLPRFARSIYLFGRLDGSSSAICETFSPFYLLRVLTISRNVFRLFPLMITKLIHLRYLEVTCKDSLPSSISELQNLQTLIYEQDSAYASLPVEIWMMIKLRHIQLGRANFLPSPRTKSIQDNLVTGLPNLKELSALCYTSCTNEVFSGIPNLKRLIIYRTLARELGNNQLIDMSSLRKLEALKCFSQVAPVSSIKRFGFPTSLKRLTLSGWFKFTWEEISTLVLLPNLEELKLKDKVVCDGLWRLSDEDKFQSLKLLLFSQLEIKRWEASGDSFPNLKRLVLKYCNNLEEIPTDFGDIYTLESIELHNCSTRAEESASKIEQEQEDMGNSTLQVYIHNTNRTEAKADDKGKAVHDS